MMEGAGSVASIRRPLNSNATQRSYTEYQYQYNTRPQPTTNTTNTTTTSTTNTTNTTNNRSCRCCRTCCSTPAASTLANLGVCGLVLGYTVLGAFTFMALESGVTESHVKPSPVIVRGSPERMDKIVNDIRSRTVERLWSITEDLNILYKDNWTRLATQEVIKFQDSLVHTIRGIQGSGNTVYRTAGTTAGSTQQASGNHRWTFSSSFLYSLTLITTIGYGSVTPRTTWGKIVTIIYALVGIPLMLVYLSTVGDLLARNFRRLYGKLCGCHSGSSNNSNSSSGKPSPNDSYRVRHISSKQNSIDGSLKLHPDDDLVKIERNHPLDFPSDPTTPTDSRQNFLHHHHHHHFHNNKTTRVPISLCLFMVTAYICGGAFLFNKLENWTFLEGSFFCFTSLGTIGFGDLIPGSHSSWKLAQISILSASAYILVGMALIAMCFNLLQDEVIILARKFGKLCGLINKKRRKNHRSGNSEESESEMEDLAMAVVSS